MKQLQFYKYATWGLLLVNISMIAFFFLTAPPPHHHAKKGGNRLINLKWDKQQDESFEKLRLQHIQQMGGFNDQQRELLKPYFNRVTDQNKPINSDSLLNQIQLVERKKIESTYQHFQDVKSILKPEQHNDFEQFIKHAINKILLEKKEHAPRTKDK